MNGEIFMTKYVLNRCKKATWLVVIIMLTSAISTIMANYIYKFIGFVIDYGLNYTGKENTGEMGFLFSGKFGDYGSLQLIIAICVCMVISALVSYVAILISWYLQKRGYYYIANGYRKDIFNATKGKKLAHRSGSSFPGVQQGTMIQLPLYHSFPKKAMFFLTLPALAK